MQTDDFVRRMLRENKQSCSRAKALPNMYLLTASMVTRREVETLGKVEVEASARMMFLGVVNSLFDVMRFFASEVDFRTAASGREC